MVGVKCWDKLCILSRDPSTNETLYRVCFEILENEKDSCLVKLKIEYDVKEEAASNASLVTIKPLEGIASVTTSYLLKMKNANEN